MSKLSLDALKERANAIASEELMASINGGTENSCHNGIVYYNSPNGTATISKGKVVVKQ